MANLINHSIQKDHYNVLNLEKSVIRKRRLNDNKPVSLYNITNTF